MSEKCRTRRSSRDLIRSNISGPLGRPSRKSNSESLDEAGNAAQIHIKLVTRAKRRKPLWIRSTVEQLRS